MRILKILTAVVSITFLSLTSASATTLIPMDLKDLTAKAELIFVGTVINIRSERQTHTIDTYVTFSDLRVLKGSYVAATIEMRLLGGSIAGESVQVYGMPNFVVGEKNNASSKIKG